MKHDDRAPFRTLRDLVVKDLHGEKSLLISDNDPSFAHAALNVILDSEAYILNRYARDYLVDLMTGLSTEDLRQAIANTQMPFDSIWIETIVGREDGAGDASIGALVTRADNGIKVFPVHTLHDLKPWQPIYAGVEIAFQPDDVRYSKTPVAHLYDRFAAHEGTTPIERMREEMDNALRIASIFAVLCATLSRPKILERDGVRPPSKSDVKAAHSAGRRPPRFAPTVIRLSKAGRTERNEQEQNAQSAHSARSAHWVRGHFFVARNGHLTWRKSHVRGIGDPTARVKYVTE